MPKPPLSAMMFACWLAVVGWAPGAQAGDETEFLAAAPPILSARVLVDAGRETGPVDIPVQLTLSRPADEAFMVPLHVEGNSATAGADFTPVTRALQFERGVMTRTVTIDVRDDPEDEPREELLSVHLGTPQPLDDAGAIPALLVTPVTPAVIIDNDTRLGLEVNSAAEGETAMLRVRRAFASPEPVTLSLEAAPESAAAGADFVFEGREITLAPGELDRAVPIPLLADTVKDPHETFRVHAESAQPRIRIVPPAVTVVIAEPCSDAPAPDPGVWRSRARLPGGHVVQDHTGQLRHRDPCGDVVEFRVEAQGKVRMVVFRRAPGAASYTGTSRTRGCETRWTLDPGARELDGGYVGDCGGRSLSATVRMTRIGDR